MGQKKSTAQSITSITIIIFLLVFFGLIMLTSTSSVVGYANFGDNYYYLKHQLLYGFLPGLVLFFLCSKVNYKFWQRYSLWFLLASIILLILVFVPGIGASYNRARSWINIGDFSLQPSEIAKLTLLVYLAGWLAKSKEHIKSFFHGLLPFLILAGIIIVLIALQPDVGTMSIIILIAVGVYFIAGVKLSHLFSLALISSVGLMLLIITAPYRLDRIMTFLKPSADVQGIGYHINQSLLAVGSGGLFGLGFGKSRQKFEYLPEVAGDSIFAIIAEELGFILCLIFIMFFIYFIMRILKISKNSLDDFAKFFSAGFAIWLGGQTLINIGSMVGLLPLTGVPLPFISYGGTSLITIMAGCGILVNITKKQKH